MKKDIELGRIKDAESWLMEDTDSCRVKGASGWFMEEEI